MGALLRLLATLLRGLARKKALTAAPRRKALPPATARSISDRLADAKIDPPQPGVRVKKFSPHGEPSSITKRLDQKGKVTHYMEYGSDGLPVKRVDLTGSSHGGVPTPHVLDYTRNCGRNGKIFVNKSATVRPARPEEIP